MDGRFQGQVPVLASGANGDIIAYSHVGNGMLGELIDYRRLASDGALQASTNISNALFLAINKIGELAYRRDDYALMLLGTDSSSRLIAEAGSYPAIWSSPQWRRSVLHDDGGLAYLTPTVQEGIDVVSMARISAGGVDWTAPVVELPADLTLGATALASGPAGETFALVHFHRNDGSDDARQARIAAVSNDGNLAWRNGFTGADLGEPVIHVGVSGRLLVATPMQDGRAMVLRGFDTASGQLTGMKAVDCADLPCSSVSAQITDDGMTTLARSAAGHPVAVSGAIELFDAESIPVNQSALNGQWYAPYTNGQGFSIHYFAEAKTLFIPWFTFSRNGGDDVQALRWYALQGTVEANATRATLAILEHTGGTFGQAGNTQRIVGEAQVRFPSCHDGIIEYRFNDAENGGAEGSIALERLLPLAEDCSEADGSTTTATARFDGMLTGHWYDPSTAGQGLEIHRIQPRDGRAGAFFATWFTYDPGPSDGDSNDQHWFTLQGLDTSSGNVGATIVQTLGGRFDSVPTDQVFGVGSVTLTTMSCDTLRLAYRFEDGPAAGEFGGAQGEMTLRRIGQCPR